MDGARDEMGESAVDIGAILAAGQAAWPHLQVKREALRAFVQDRLGRPGAPGLLPANAGDLFLACACLHRSEGAHVEFERRFRATSDVASRRVDAQPSFADEVWQRLCVDLFVESEPGQAKIGQYRGRAPLARWLLITAYREALKAKTRGQKPALSLDDDVLVAAITCSWDPGEQAEKLAHAAVLTGALRAALAALPAQQRDILRLSLVEKVSQQRIGELLGIDQSNVNRRLRSIRERIVEHVTTELQGRLQLSESACRSLIALARSQVDLTLSRVLGQTEE